MSQERQNLKEEVRPITVIVSPNADYVIKNNVISSIISNKTLRDDLGFT